MVVGVKLAQLEPQFLLLSSLLVNGFTKSGPRGLVDVQLQGLHRLQLDSVEREAEDAVAEFGRPRFLLLVLEDWLGHFLVHDSAELVLRSRD